jgi:glycosyltransferase involved in cell wall biosynthesis
MPKIFFLQLQNMELIVENGNPRGGAAVQTLVWMQAFRDLGFEVFQGKFDNDTRRLLPEFDWVKTLPIYHPKKNKKRLAWFTHRFPSIYQAIKKSQCDYVYVSIPKWNTFYIALICKILKVKFILRIANDNICDKRIYLNHSKLEAKYISLSFKTSDFILTQNEFQYRNLKAKFPLKRILKIFNPIVINKNVLFPKAIKIGFIAWVANFRYQKNLALLFQIASTLVNEKFKIAGIPLLPMDSETEESFNKLKELPNVEFLDNIPKSEILTFFSKAKFLLNTSRYEGFSNTFLEAMLTGTPILSTNKVNPDGIIDTFNLGYIYDDEKDLKKILDSIGVEEYLLKSKNCIAFVQNNHDHLVLGKHLLEFLES